MALPSKEQQTQDIREAVLTELEKRLGTYIGKDKPRPEGHYVTDEAFSRLVMAWVTLSREDMMMRMAANAAARMKDQTGATETMPTITTMNPMETDG